MQATLKQNQPDFKFLFFSAALIILAAVLFVALAQSHGARRHGWNAVDVRSCLNDQGPLQVWENPFNGRRANLCQLDEQTFGLQIIIQDGAGTWNEITAFVKNKLTRLDQVMQYLRNGGYQLLR
jgi:hypothetical protein